MKERPSRGPAPTDKAAVAAPKRPRPSPMPPGDPVARAKRARGRTVLAGSAIAATLAVIACDDKEAIAPQVNEAPQSPPPQAHFEDAEAADAGAKDAASEASDASTDSGDASDAGNESG